MLNSVTLTRKLRNSWRWSD